jgi:hypothetical protein
MTDDLVKRLRIGIHQSTDEQALRNEAADRIEQLEAECEQWKAGFQVADEKWFKISARCEALEAALRGICDDPRDANKSYPELLAEIRIEARAALTGEKKDD